jgi:hypothetical protein
MNEIQRAINAPTYGPADPVVMPVAEPTLSYQQRVAASVPAPNPGPTIQPLTGTNSFLGRHGHQILWTAGALSMPSAYARRLYMLLTASLIGGFLVMGLTQDRGPWPGYTVPPAGERLSIWPWPVIIWAGGVYVLVLLVQEVRACKRAAQVVVHQRYDERNSVSEALTAIAAAEEAIEQFLAIEPEPALVERMTDKLIIPVTITSRDR